MGNYVNVGNRGFRNARNKEYVDKSELIAVVNSTLNTEDFCSCVTRCRRFGKSMAAKMLCAYYDQSCDSRSLFSDLKIAEVPSFEEHLNKYPVIFLDMSDFVTEIKDATIVKVMQQTIKADIHSEYSDIPMEAEESLMTYLTRVTARTEQQFIFIIDEWDAICREFDKQPDVMDEYVDWLRRMFKSGQTQNVFAGVYMTGILPIKKYNTQSALNNFIEYSMVNSGELAPFFGFTKNEVGGLAEKYGVDCDELVKWYDGYQIGNEPSMFNPNSVIQAVKRHRCSSYWAATGAFDTVADYIKLNYDGLKDSVLYLLSGGRVKVNTTKFQNDMSVVRSRDDVLTVLIHLGYLAYDWRRKECYVPNLEVLGELSNAVEDSGWENVVKMLQQSVRLLEATLHGEEEIVARALDAAHDENTSILSYNDENSLACVISIAYYYARNDYIIHREMASGKGIADLVFIPRKNVDSPALVVELKNNKSAIAAIDQIKQKHYPDKIAQYTDNLLLVGINYDSDTKSHTCIIEKYQP